MCADRIPPQTSTEPAEEGAFGELLRRAREEQGIALGAVSRRTRIAPHHLEALERSDLDALPGGPFGRSYVRAYAEVLGIDPEPILEAYRVRERQRGLSTPEGEHRMLEELAHIVGRSAEATRAPARGHARPVRLTAALAAIVVLATLGWLLGRSRPPDEPVARSPTRPTPSAPPEAALPRPAPAEPPAPTKAGATSGRDRAVDVRAVTPPTEVLQVSQFGVGTGVVDRRLVGRADRLPEGSRVVFWTEVLGGQPGHVIRHVWFQEGRAVMRANLAIRGPYWRTHSTLVLPRGSAGRWTVEARTSDGRLLARYEFVCEPLEARPPGSTAE